MANNNDNKVLNVPNLRFPEFCKEWYKVTLRQIASKINTKNKDNVISTVFSNSATQGIVLQSAYFDKEIANKDNLNGYFVVEPNDFVYNPRLSANAKVGAMSVNHTNKIGLVSPLYTIFRVNSSEIHIDFLESIFKSNVWHSYMRSIANFGARDDRMNIKNDDLFALPLSITSIEEQRKIAKLLNITEERIATQNKIIDRLQSLIKGLPHNIAELGLQNGCWEETLLSSVLVERKELNTELHTVYSVSVSEGVVNQVEYLGRSFAAKDTSNYHVAKYGDIVYTKSPTGKFPYGIVKQSYIGVTAISPLYGVYSPISFEIGAYLHYYFMSAISATNYLYPLIQKGAKNTINISNQRFLENRVPMPIIKTEICNTAKALIAIQKKLSLEKKSLALLITQRKFLLQQMFI